MNKIKYYLFEIPNIAAKMVALCIASVIVAGVAFGINALGEWAQIEPVVNMAMVSIPVIVFLIWYLKNSR